MTIKATTYAELITACASYVREAKPDIKTPEQVYRLMAPLFMANQQESIFVLLLDTKSRVIGAPQETTRGLVDSCPSHPREVFRLAIHENASAVVLVHNLCGAPHKLCYVQRRLMLSRSYYAVD